MLATTGMKLSRSRIHARLLEAALDFGRHEIALQATRAEEKEYRRGTCECTSEQYNCSGCCMADMLRDKQKFLRHKKRLAERKIVRLVERLKGV